MKLLLTIFISLLSFNLSIAQDRQISLKQMQVSQYYPEAKEYKVVQEWCDYPGTVLLRDSMMYIGGETDKLEDLSSWAKYRLNLPPVKEVKDEFWRENSVWYVADSEMECVVDIRYYNDGSIIFEQVMGYYILRFKVTLS